MHDRSITALCEQANKQTSSPSMPFVAPPFVCSFGSCHPLHFKRLLPTYLYKTISSDNVCDYSCIHFCCSKGYSRSPVLTAR